MFAADGKGHFDIIAQKLALNFGFEQKITAVADDQEFGHRTAITQATMPRAAVFWVSSNQPALFFIFAAEVISVEIAAIHRFFHWLALQSEALPPMRTKTTATPMAAVAQMAKHFVT